MSFEPARTKHAGGAAVGEKRTLQRAKRATLIRCRQPLQPPVVPRVPSPAALATPPGRLLLDSEANHVAVGGKQVQRARACCVKRATALAVTPTHCQQGASLEA